MYERLTDRISKVVCDKKYRCIVTQMARSLKKKKKAVAKDYFLICCLIVCIGTVDLAGHDLSC